MNTNQNTGALTRGAIIAALYAAITLLLAPISYGEVQVRIAEALTLLPIILPEAVRCNDDAAEFFRKYL